MLERTGNRRESERWSAISLSAIKTLGTMRKYREEGEREGEEKV